MRKLLVSAFLGLLVALLGACAETKQVRDVRTSGFLDDYSILRQGGEDETARIYSNPKTNWSAYDKILLAPITLWRPSQEQLEYMAESQDLEHLATFFYHTLYQKFSEDYEMVDEPAPGTLHVQVGLTSVEESWVMLDVITTLPGGRLFSRGLEYSTGKPLFTGEASVEFRVTDAETGDLLRAGVDRRVGAKTLDKDSFDNWTDAEAVLEFWANRAKWQLCTLRGETSCVHPQ